MPALGTFQREITVDPSTPGQTMIGPEITVTGDAPPAAFNWWPLVIAAAVLAAIWWISERDDEEEEGEGSFDRPFDE